MEIIRNDAMTASIQLGVWVQWRRKIGEDTMTRSNRKMKLVYGPLLMVLGRKLADDVVLFHMWVRQ